MTGPDGRWRIFIDRGGTFTDIVAIAPDGRLESLKLLSENPAHYADSTVEGVRRLLGIAPDQPIPEERIAFIRLGTTIATNALLERKGPRLALVVTHGMGDVLLIGRQNRPRLFDLAVRRPCPFHERVIEADERVDAEGRILRPLDEARLRHDLVAARADGIEAVAIAFLHGFRCPDHEARAKAIALEAGFRDVVASHEAAPLERFVPRGQTALLDAWLSPAIRRYREDLARHFGRIPIQIMQSSGGLVAAERLTGRNAVLSGPAGGVTAVVETARRAGFSRVIGFDMGGTSTDVSHFAGSVTRRAETEIEGLALLAPALDIHTVAAGGGSICRFDGLRFLVGPESAGASPGPACYGHGGPLTVTDCNLLLGRIDPDFFPHVFGPGQKDPLDRRAARDRARTMAEEIAQATRRRMTVEEIAEGFLAIAVEHMARAIRRITLARGHDAARCCLSVFGGAGGQHGCAVAEALGITQVYIHPMAGVLSALGIGMAAPSEIRERAVLLPLAPDHEGAIEDHLAALAEMARDALRADPLPAARHVLRQWLNIRAGDSDAALTIPHDGDIIETRRRFAEEHRRVFGFLPEDVPLFVLSARVELAAEPTPLPAPHATDGPHRPLATRRVHFGGRSLQTPVYCREDLAIERVIDGPAILLDGTGTTVIAPGWQGSKRKDGSLLLRREAKAARRVAKDGDKIADPVRLELFNNLFMSIAEQMGTVLEKTAHSVNMKERLDFSCALFDRSGDLIANAPHMPVHLGSMGESVRAVIATLGPELGPDDAAMLNDPYAGGTHLPDITVVTPVFIGAETTPHFYLASRGHHADIGGIAPGSMPAFSRGIPEEGLRIPPMAICRDGRFLEDDVRRLLTSGPWPARSPDQNIADLKAQLAANAAGRRDLERLVSEHGLPQVLRYMQHVKDHAAEATRRVLDHLPDGEAVYEMDGGRRIAVAIRTDRAKRRAIIDFSGTSGPDGGNFNAPRAICRAAVLYVLRCLTREDIPLNDGCFAPIELRIPEGSLLDPVEPAAVVAGNVETSQAIVNALLLASAAAAAAQGTMNNLTFGNERHQYYETIGGGTGAGPGFDGEDAIQSHMTNSRLTDIELLEVRHPVRVERFAIRRGSGGEGQHRGGDGAVRALLFLEEMEANILSSHRETAPPGLEGGGSGRPGSNRIMRADGREEILPGVARTTLAPGDRLIIETPGGGGFGAA